MLWNLGFTTTDKLFSIKATNQGCSAYIQSIWKYWLNLCPRLWFNVFFQFEWRIPDAFKVLPCTCFCRAAYCLSLTITSADFTFFNFWICGISIFKHGKTWIIKFHDLNRIMWTQMLHHLQQLLQSIQNDFWCFWWSQCLTPYSHGVGETGKKLSITIFNFPVNCLSTSFLHYALKSMNFGK